MKKIKGITLEYVENIPGFTRSVGGYRVDISNYHFESPLLYGLDSDSNNLFLQEDENISEQSFINPENNLSEIEFTQEEIEQVKNCK